jgi:anti-anti-sigma factor
MEIIVDTREGWYELRLKGRLDANWAEYVGNAIESAVRAGQHYIDIDMALVDYISSMGIGVLMKYYKQLNAVSGLLRVVNPHEYVLEVLKMSKLAELLCASEETSRSAISRPSMRCWERGGIAYESHEKTEGRSLEGRLQGCPEKFATGRLSAADIRRMCFGPEIFGLGLGAFGSDSADSSKRIGEFLAAGGAALTQPTDDSCVPDFQIIEGQLVPEIHVLYGMTATGQFSELLRFEAADSERGLITLADLVEAVLEDLQTSAAGFVITAETARLIGATLRQSPVLADGQSPCEFPAVRDWLSFTAEPTNERNLAIIVGFVEQEPPRESAAFLHRIGAGTNALGHFHAAVFPYRPLPKGNINLQNTISNLLGSESAETVMHLLADDREFEGVGQTELVRGACWVGPLLFPRQHTSSVSASQ